jgi:hypothetical protein
MQEAQIVLDRIQAMWQARCLQAAAEFGMPIISRTAPRTPGDTVERLAGR